MAKDHGESLAALDNGALLARTRALVRRGCEVEADLLVHLAEVDERRLFAARGFRSMWAFCQEELGFSEDVTCNRLAVVRLIRWRPELLEAVRSGRMHLAGLRLLGPHLAGPGADALLAEAAGKSKREIEEIVARCAPRPDVPPGVRRLPSRRRAAAHAAAAASGAGARSAAAAASGAGATVDAGGGEAPMAGDEPTAHAGDGAAQTPVGDRAPFPPGAGSPVGAPPSHRPVVRPLSPGRYKVQFTADEALHAKLREAQDLLSHQLSRSDLAGLFDRALTLLIEDTRKKRFGVGRKPRKARALVAARPAEATDTTSATGPTGAPPPSSAPPPAASTGAPPPRAPSAAGASRHIPADIVRQVYERDEGRCAFVSDEGRRCDSRSHIELHHLDGFARTHEHRLDRIELRCRAHNQYEADVMFGPSFMNEKRRGTRPGAGDAGRRTSDDHAPEAPMDTFREQSSRPRLPPGPPPEPGSWQEPPHPREPPHPPGAATPPVSRTPREPPHPRVPPRPGVQGTATM